MRHFGTVGVPSRVNVLLNRARTALRQGDPTAAERYFRAAQLVDSTPVSGLEYARWLIDGGAFPSAVDILQLAWEQAKRLCVPAWRCEACRELARTYRLLDEPTLAEQFQQLAIAAALDVSRDDLAQRVTRLQRLAESLCRRKRWREAVAILKQAASLADRLDNSEKARVCRSAANRLRTVLCLLSAEPQWN